jgi:hypothetical protein
MQELVKEIEMPKTYRERLDELNVGGFIDILSVEERNKFSTTMYRDFHNKAGNTKQFTIRTDKETNQKAIWRIK